MAFVASEKEIVQKEDSWGQSALQILGGICSKKRCVSKKDILCRSGYFAAGTEVDVSYEPFGLSCDANSLIRISGQGDVRDYVYFSEYGCLGPGEEDFETWFSEHFDLLAEPAMVGLFRKRRGFGKGTTGAGYFFYAPDEAPEEKACWIDDAELFHLSNAIDATYRTKGRIECVGGAFEEGSVVSVDFRDCTCFDPDGLLFLREIGTDRWTAVRLSIQGNVYDPQFDYSRWFAEFFEQVSI